MNRNELKTIIKETIENILFESNPFYQDVAKAIVDNVYNKLISEGYTDEELENIGNSKDNVEIITSGDNLNLVFGEDVIYSASIHALSHVFFDKAETALYNYILSKLGRDNKPIDLTDEHMFESRVLQLVKERLLSEAGHIYAQTNEEI